LSEYTDIKVIFDAILNNLGGFDYLAHTSLNKNNIRTSQKYERRQDFYKNSYNLILRHFQNLDWNTVEFDDAMESLILVYSWMGYGIVPNFEDARHNFKPLQQAMKRHETISDIELFRTTLPFCCHSVIATSKWLHFSFPERFAMWDSRVAGALGINANSRNRINSVEVYLAYNAWLRSAALSAASAGLVQLFLGLPPGFSALRAKEFLLFRRGQSDRLTVSPRIG
jgi:hypothetical protein